MRHIKLFLAIFIIYFSMESFANALSAPRFNLGGIVLPHAAEHSNSGSIPLQALTDYESILSSNLYWDVECDYNTQETGGAPPPTASSPLAVIFSVPEANISIVGSNYTSKGFIEPSGKLEIIIKYFDYFPVKMDFTNYDSSGDFTISNCVGTLRVVPGRK